jgi:hypothetical protein
MASTRLAMQKACHAKGLPCKRLAMTVEFQESTPYFPVIFSKKLIPARILWGYSIRDKGLITLRGISGYHTQNTTLSCRARDKNSSRINARSRESVRIQ